MSIGSRKTSDLLRTALFIAAVTLFMFTSCTPPEKKPVPPLNPAAAKIEIKPELEPEPARPGQLTRMPLGSLYQLVQNKSVLIFDVRPAFSYGLGHIPGAISWPMKSFDIDPFKYDPQIRSANASNIPVVIYCTDLACPDGLNVATALAARDHSVSVLQGGYEAWKIATD